MSMAPLFTAISHDHGESTRVMIPGLSFGYRSSQSHIPGYVQSQKRKYPGSVLARMVSFPSRHYGEFVFSVCSRIKSRLFSEPYLLCSATLLFNSEIKGWPAAGVWTAFASTISLAVMALP